MEKARKPIRHIADKLKESYNPEKIILFGSYAWGLPDEDSDIDILIITPEELKSRLEIGDQFLQEIISRGEVAYG